MIKQVVKIKALHCRTIFITLLVVLSGCFSNPASAKEPEGKVKENDLEKTEALTLKDIVQQPFSYDRENRSDPFMPFVSQQVQVRTAEVVVKGETEEEVLSGMRLFEPGQLQLVAIVFSGSKAVAMVQDSTGKGHFLEKGEKVGRRGEVKRIIPNIVEIEEWYLSATGKKRYKTIEMVLSNEGEK